MRMIPAAAAPLLAVLALVAAATPSRAQAPELTPHLAVYEVATGRAPAGASAPQVKGTYVYRLQATCTGHAFQQRLRFEMRKDGAATLIDQVSTGGESRDGARYEFEHQSSVDGRRMSTTKGVVETRDGARRAVFRGSKAAPIEIPADTRFPVSIVRGMVGAWKAGETGYEARFFFGAEEKSAMAVSALFGKPPKRTEELPAPEGDTRLLEGRERFYFRASFRAVGEGGRIADEPTQEQSSVTLDNGIEIWGTHEEGDLRMEYRLIRIEAIEAPKCP
ncbi:MAG: DUF1849 family protein [Rhodospirillales bacterium]|nr:MAG: DUF1849 family protein [Rhodospirillales bacterium]